MATFPPEPVSVRQARRFLREFLAEHDLGDALADNAELALSEVTTNAVLHAHSPFDVRLTVERGRALRVSVRDGSTQLPRPRHYAEQATTGRGMDLIAAYTQDCGVDLDPPDGKLVWFLLDPSEAVDRTEQDLLDAWDLDLPDNDDTVGVGAGDPIGRVLLRGLPPTLWLAAREHHDAVLRELALFAVEHPTQAPAADRLALADHARNLISVRLVEELHRTASGNTGRTAGAHRALPAGHPSNLPDTPLLLDLSLDLDLDAADGSGQEFAALQDVLDNAERLARQGLLLARPGLPEVVAVRDWACEQVISQLAGVPPSAWPGTAHERFTDASREPTASPPVWDTQLVLRANRGVVAADDTNRILAVSRPLADALGWDVQDLIGRRVVVLIPPELREAHVAGFTRHLTTGETHAIGVPLRLPVLRRDGHHVQADFLIEQAPTEGGRTVYIAWIEPDQS